MESGAGARQLSQPSLDGGVDVLVRVPKLELASIQLFSDPAQAALDRSELWRREKTGSGKAARVGDAAGDVIPIELEVSVDCVREALENRVHAATETPAPEFRRRFFGYGASLFMSPSRPFNSRSCRRPWTCAAVRTPIPHSLMNPAAADWSKTSPLPYVASECWYS
jgi:hypothetical protein